MTGLKIAAVLATVGVSGIGVLAQVNPIAAGGQLGRMSVASILGVVAVAAVMVLLAAGCATYPARTYTVQDHVTRIEVVPALEIDEYAQKHGLGRIGGYSIHLPDASVLVVPQNGKVDANGKPLPDFRVLGHEYWHNLNLGGEFHDKPLR